jgi:hypothetical protein
MDWRYIYFGHYQKTKSKKNKKKDGKENVIPPAFMAEAWARPA